MRDAQAGEMHHVTTRSIAEEHIFKDGGDYATGITLLAGLVAEGVADVHAFCFMPTHYHVLGTFTDVTTSTSSTGAMPLRTTGGTSGTEAIREFVTKDE